MKFFTQVVFFLAPLLLIFWVFKSWFLSPTISAGDFWYYFRSMFDNFNLYPYAWYPNISDGLGSQGFAYQNGTIISAIVVDFAKLFNLTWETSTKFLFYIPYIILSFASA